VKISVSLPEEDLAFLDAYAQEHDFPSRSAALRHALSVLRSGTLAPAYEDAWKSWSPSETAAWSAGSADGLRR
jgi:Arc/MetJ-type ribon-helix-helix transcriptional regulator